MDGVTVYPLRVYYCFCDVSRESSADVLSVGCVSMRIARCCSREGGGKVKKLLTCEKTIDMRKKKKQPRHVKSGMLQKIAVMLKVFPQRRQNGGFAAEGV